MAHSCAVCKSPLLERPVLALKTLSLICQKCLGQIGSSAVVKDNIKRVFLKCTAEEAHILVRMGAQISGKGLTCLETESNKFSKWLQTGQPIAKGGMGSTVTSKPPEVQRA